MIYYPTEVSELKESISRVRQSIENKRDALKDLLKLRDWKTADGTVAPETAASQQANWDTQEIPYTWPPRDGAKTFYYHLHIPADFMGISLSQSEVSLEFWWAIGAQVYVDGVKVYGVDYWADTQVVPIILTDALKHPISYELVAQCRQGDGFGFFYIADLRIS